MQRLLRRRSAAWKARAELGTANMAPVAAFGEASSHRLGVTARAQGIVGWAAFAVVVAAAVPIGANVPIAWLGLVLATMVLFVCQCLIDLFDRRVPDHFARLLPAAALYVLVLAWGVCQLAGGAPRAWVHESWTHVEAAGAIAIDPTFGRHVIARLTAYAMLFWIALRAAGDPLRAANFVRATAVYSTILAGYGIATLLLGANWITGAENPQSVTSTFVNRNSYATYAGFGVLANLAALSLSFESGRAAAGTRHMPRDVLERLVQGAWIFAFGAAIVSAALVLTVSRGGILATVAGVVVFFLVALRKDRGTRAVMPAGVVAALVAAYVAAVGLAAFLARLFASSAEEARFTVYPRIVEAIADRPWLGYGPGGFFDAFRPYVPPSAATGEWDMAHNSYLENALEFGIPAAIAFYAALFLVVRRLWQGARTRRRMVAVPSFAFAVAIVGALHSIFDFSLQMPATGALFAMILGIGWAQSFSSRLA